MAEDAVFSTRIDQEIKAEFLQMAEAAGISQKDYFAQMVQIAKQKTLEESDQGRPSKNLSTLRHSLAQIEKMYVSIETQAQTQAQADEEKLVAAKEEIISLRARAHEMEEIYTEKDRRIREEIADVRAETNRRVEEVEGINKTLSEKLQEAQEKGDTVRFLQQALDDSKAKINAMEATAAAANKLKEEKEMLVKEKAELDRKLTEVKQEFKHSSQNWELEKNSLNLDMEKAVLATQREAMEQIGQLREALAEARERIAQLEMGLVKATAPKRGAKTHNP